MQLDNLYLKRSDVRTSERQPQGEMQGKFKVNARQTRGDGKGKNIAAEGQKSRPTHGKSNGDAAKKQGVRTCICVFGGAAGPIPKLYYENRNLLKQNQHFCTKVRL